jgi:AraC family transcriptional regulator
MRLEQKRLSRRSVGNDTLRTMAFAPIAQTQALRATSVGDLAVTECLAAAGTRLGWHAHEHACVVLLLDGSFTEVFRARTVSCSTPAALYKPAGEPHANEYGRVGARFLIVELHPTQVDQWRDRGAALDGIRAVHEREVVDIAARLYRELRRVDAYSMLSIGGLVHELLAAVSRGGGMQSTSAPFWLRRVREQLAERFAERLSIADIASDAGVHPDHLSRCFRRHYGTLIGEYVRSLRLDWAARTLAGTEKPLAEVAIDAGFIDQSEFTRRFREQFGTTPGRYRSALHL